MRYVSRVMAMAVLAVSALAQQTVDAQGSGPRFQITITNLTARQVFTPIFAASHLPGIQLFTLGQPASRELEILAEEGDNAPLRTLAAQFPSAVGGVANSGAMLMPGQSVTLTVPAGDGFSAVSVGAMLVPTNDAFFAVNGVGGPTGVSPVTVMSPAYDSGTEANDELCAAIPGPPSVCQGQGFNPSRAGGEGYVHIHRGMHGVGNLSAAIYDWRNPAAQIVIRRVP